jgi:hypothetical protein
MSGRASHRLTIATLLVAAGCGRAPHPDGKVELSLAAAGARHDVAKVAFKVVAAGDSCGGTALASAVAALPATTVDSSQAGPDAGAGHLAASTVLVLAVGSYRVCATPLAVNDAPSAYCGLAQAALVVSEGATARVILVAQCAPPSGAVPGTSALDDPPRITAIMIGVRDTCGPGAITVAANDPNGAALSYAWAVVSGPSGASVSGAATATFRATAAATYGVRVTVSDPLGAATSLVFPVSVAAGASCETDGGGPDSAEADGGGPGSADAPGAAGEGGASDGGGAGRACGNGVVTPGEECEPDGVTCDDQCKTIRCGNGLIQDREYCEYEGVLCRDCASTPYFDCLRFFGSRVPGDPPPVCENLPPVERKKCQSLMECLVSQGFQCLNTFTGGHVGSLCVTSCLADFQSVTGVADASLIEAECNDSTTLVGQLSRQVEGLYSIDGNYPCGKHLYERYIFNLRISEVDVDSPGADTAEFVEIQNASTGPVDLKGASLAFTQRVGCGTPSQYLRIPLSGLLRRGDYLVVGDPSVIVPSGALKIDLPHPMGNIANGLSDVTLYSANGDFLSGLGTLVPVPGVGPYGSIAPAPADPGPGSICRPTQLVSTYQEILGQDWEICSPPSPGSYNNYSYTAPTAAGAAGCPGGSGGAAAGASGAAGTAGGGGTGGGGTGGGGTGGGGTGGGGTGGGGTGGGGTGGGGTGATAGAHAFAGAGGAGATPAFPTANLALWLDASALTGNDGDPIATWPDLSGGHHDASQADATRRPILRKGANGIAGKNAVEYPESTLDGLTGAFPTAGAVGYTFYFVAKKASEKYANSVMSSRADVYLTPGIDWTQRLGWANVADAVGSGGTKQAPVPLGAVDGAAALVGRTYYARYRKTPAVWDLDGAGAGTFADGSMPTGDYLYTIGTSPNGDIFAGQIAEILVYTAALSDAADAQVRDYLKGKYGLSAGVDPGWSGAGGPGPSTGVPTANLALWLDASALVGNDGDAIAAWPDGSGAGHDASQAVASARPALKKGTAGLNGRNVVRFDGSTDFLTGSFPTGGAQSYRFYFVARTGTTLSAYGTLMSSGVGAPSSTSGIVWGQVVSTDPSYLAGWGGPTQDCLLQGPSSAVPLPGHTYLLNYRKSYYTWTVSGFDGPISQAPCGSDGWDRSMPTGSYNFQIGAQNANRPQTFFNGDIAEILVYAFGDLDGGGYGDANVKAYLKRKYALP